MMMTKNLKVLFSDLRLLGALFKFESGLKRIEKLTLLKYHIDNIFDDCVR